MLIYIYMLELSVYQSVFNIFSLSLSTVTTSPLPTTKQRDNYKHNKFGSSSDTWYYPETKYVITVTFSTLKQLYKFYMFFFFCM